MQAIIAELTVKDVNASMAWYQEMGFSVELEGIHDEDGLQWVSMGHEGRSVWLLRHDVSHLSTEHAPRVTLYLQVEKVDDLYQRLTDRGLKVDSEPENKWYGLREFHVSDPDGFGWTVNQPISPEETPPRPR